MLRIDVDHPDPGRNYGVPKDNPFVDRPGARPELWAYGLRNPWRLSFDRESGQLWVGQNGQDLWEQVYLIKKGGNYGWSLDRGEPRLPSPSARRAPTRSCRRPPSTPTARPARSPAAGSTAAPACPTWSGPTSTATGPPAASGGSSTTARRPSGTASWSTRRSTSPASAPTTPASCTSSTTASGFYRFEPTTEADRPTQPFPTRLSETGLFASVADHKPHPAALAVRGHCPAVGRRGDDGAVRRPAGPGADRAEAPAQRGRGVDLARTARSWCRRSASTWSTTPASRPASGSRPGCWSASRGNGPATPTAGTPRRPTPSWSPPPARPRSSRWPTRPTPSGRREQTWRFPARTECLVCHSRAAGFVLGFTPLQLDRDRDYGGVVDNQLRTLEHIGVFQGALPARRDDRPPAGQPLRRRRPRSRPGSGRTCTSTARPATSRKGAATPAWSWTSPPRSAEMRLIDEAPIHDRFGIADARLVAPGSPERSVLYHADLAPGDRPDAAPGVHRGRPQGRRADRRVDSRLAPGQSLTSD